MATAASSVRGRAAAVERADRIWRVVLKPPPRLTLSEWADTYRVLSPEAAAEPGRWRTSRVPYLRGIMDTISEFAVRRVVWVAASQVGKTEVINNFAGYAIHHDPGPMLVVNYSVTVAEAWSKDRFAPMVRDTPELRERIGDPRSRDSGNTILHKVFPGGHITCVGANSAASLSSRPIRYLLFDEVDRYPPSAGSEGDPVKLGEQRTRTFRWSKKVLEISSPGLEESSRIMRSFKLSDQRYYFVPCPHCDHYQVLDWDHVEWETSQAPESEEREHHPETAAYRCDNCAVLIEDVDKFDMLVNGEWRPTNPEGAYPGFHISALYSPWVSWPELATEFLEVKDDRDELQTFVNLQLGEPFAEVGGKVTTDELEGRRESWPADVPTGVGVLTAGVDVQDDRLELAIKGWGHREESWLIAHHRIYGDPKETAVWNQLDYYLTRPYSHASGKTLRVLVTCVDSGHLTTEVYRFVAPRQKRGVHATKGLDQRASEPLKRTQRKNKYGVNLWSIGTEAFKDIVFARLQLELPGPGYMHFCEGTPSVAPGETGSSAGGADAEYFKQFGAEIRERKKVAGRIVRRYRQLSGRANEAIDLEVLALVALHIAGNAVRETLGERAALVSASGDEPATPKPPRRKSRIRSRGIG